MNKNEEIIDLKNGFTRNVVAVDSNFTNGKMNLTSNQLKAFYSAGTLVGMKDENFKTYTVNIKDFAKQMGMSATNSDIYELCKKLITSYVEIKINNKWRVISIFSSFDIDNDTQTLTMRFNDQMKPYLLNLKKFTKISDVKTIINFNSKYAIRFYTMLKDFRKIKTRDFNIDELSEILKLPETYNYTRFIQKVLNPAIKEINDKSELNIIDVEIIKKNGKKVTDIRLHYDEK